jgi:hypothetical protein
MVDDQVRKEVRKRAGGWRVRATVRQGERKRYHGHNEREERNWPFLGPPVGHWDDAEKLRRGGRGWKELTGAGFVLRRTVGSLLWQGVSTTLREWMRGFHDRLRQRMSSFTCSSVSVAFIIIRYMYLDLLDTMLLSWKSDTMAQADAVFNHKTTLRYIPESCHLHVRRREILQPHIRNSGAIYLYVGVYISVCVT